MSFSGRHAERIAQLDYLRKTVRIGIFGSFAEEHFRILEGVRSNLINDGFSNARLSHDLEKTHPRKRNETQDIYNLRLSHALVDESDIHLFFLFDGKEHPHRPNISTFCEISRHNTLRNSDSCLVLLEKNTAIKGLWKGYLELYRYYTFEDSLECHLLITRFCRERLFDLMSNSGIWYD